MYLEIKFCCWTIKKSKNHEWRKQTWKWNRNKRKKLMNSHILKKRGLVYFFINYYLVSEPYLFIKRLDIYTSSIINTRVNFTILLWDLYFIFFNKMSKIFYYPSDKTETSPLESELISSVFYLSNIIIH
jgi:hypothetical protein